MQAAKEHEAMAIAAGERAVARAIEARQTVWKLVDADRRRRGLGPAAGSNGGGGGPWSPFGGEGRERETHLGSTAAAADLCQRVLQIQERRKRVVSLCLLLFAAAVCCCCCRRRPLPRPAWPALQQQ